jgi:hypothetical protein
MAYIDSVTPWWVTLTVLCMVILYIIRSTRTRA